METILKLNDQLLNAPAGVLTAMLAVAFGYVLKGMKSFDNSKIPLVVVFACAVVFPLLTLGGVPNVEGKLLLVLFIPWLVRSVVIGFIIGFVAWAFHAIILKRFEDKIPFLKDWIASAETTPAIETQPKIKP